MLVKIVNCALNGDPNTGDQRLDDEGHGYVTDVAVARWIKNYFAWKGHELSIDGVKTAKDFKGMSVDEALSKFIDIRLFGAMIKGAKKDRKGDDDKSDISVTRCVNTTAVRTMAPISVHRNTITRMMQSEDDKSQNSTMGTQSFVENAVFAINMVFSGRQAEKNKVTPEDIALLKEAMQNWPKVLEGPRAGRVEVIACVFEECEDNLVPAHLDLSWADKLSKFER